jgi:hypothetical protein
MKNIDMEEIGKELALSTSAMQTFAGRWHPVQKLKRKPTLVREILMDHNKSLSLLLGAVNLDLPHGKQKARYLGEINKHIVHDLSVMDSTGRMPPSPVVFVDVFLAHVGGGDLDHTLGYYWKLKSGQVSWKGLQAETNRLFNIFKDRSKRKAYYAEIGGCSVGRPQLAGTYLEKAQPLMDSKKEDVEILYGGHFSVFKERFLDKRKNMIKKVSDDINTFTYNPERQNYPYLSYSVIIHKQLEDLLNPEKDRPSYIG